MMYDAVDITKRIADALASGTSKIEGTFSMDNIQAVAQELSRIYYMDILTIEDKYFLDTAMTEFLDKRALDFNETRNKATHSSGYVDFKGRAGTVIPKSTGFQSEILTFTTDKQIVINADGVGQAPVTCVVTGVIGNVDVGSIKNMRTIDFIEGLSVTNTEAFAGGVDEESDEAFRSRILEKIRKPYTSGNANDYVRWAKQISGVGNAICISCWDGNGTVKVIILSSEGGIPDDVIMARVTDRIEQNRPIGASISVVKAKPKSININASIKLASGFTVDAVKNNFIDSLQEYLTDKAFGTDRLLSYFKISDLLYGIEGVYDVISYTINDLDFSINALPEEFFALQEVLINVIT